MGRIQYYRRIFGAYLGSKSSQLTFWHDDPEMSNNFVPGHLGPYYMPFRQKADYSAILDNSGIPLLDYRGALGPQYNPIAIAQYGLGNCNLYLVNEEASRRSRFLRVADWLAENLEVNHKGLPVWMHHFDFEYRDILRAPWYSALAQGQGISLLVRAAQQFGTARYAEAAARAFESICRECSDGGVRFTDANGDIWLEEYLVDPPTHILNGFFWGLWGVYDYFLFTGDHAVQSLFDRFIKTLLAHLESYDTGYWSLYEHSGTWLPMLASRFYHQLHIVQLRVTERLTGERKFGEMADRWTSYMQDSWNSARAQALKAAFKLVYY